SRLTTCAVTSKAPLSNHRFVRKKTFRSSWTRSTQRSWERRGRRRKQKEKEQSERALKTCRHKSLVTWKSKRRRKKDPLQPNWQQLPKTRRSCASRITFSRLR